MNDLNIIQLTMRLGELLKSQRRTITTAESCTGGLLGHWITEVSGCSAYFAGGAVVYSDEIKARVLGVRHQTLRAVSGEVAQEMAQGALHLYQADLALAVTGVAGPCGGSLDKLVGTVYIHLSTSTGFERGECFLWQGDRRDNKQQSAAAAFQMAIDYLATNEILLSSERSTTV